MPRKLVSTRTQQMHQTSLLAHPYATLSYSWGETSSDSTALTPTQMQRACTEAYRLGLEWIWSPSLCIDFSSSAEISEYINSRFHIFRDSVLCLVYLGEVSVEAGETTSEVAGKLLLKSRWLRWIWTLPELIASKEIIFFDKHWRQLGTKTSLLTELSKATWIDRPVLENSECLSEFSVGRRMSWASVCSYDREEDLAYALVGLFDVSMTILYGEGSLAFLRLQDEILRTTNDASLFCWQAGPHAAKEYRGLLAHSPSEFSHFASIPLIEPLHIHGDVQLTSAGVVMNDVSISHSFGFEIVLPLYSEDGTARYGMCLRFWKGRYVKPYLGFTRLNAVVSQRVRHICIIRDVNTRTSAKIAMEFPLIELAQPSFREWGGANLGKRQPTEPIYHSRTHATSFIAARGFEPSAGEPHRHETLNNICMQHHGLSKLRELSGSACRPNSPPSPNNKAKLSRSSPVRISDTSPMGDYQTTKDDFPTLDDNMYLLDTTSFHHRPWGPTTNLRLSRMS